MKKILNSMMMKKIILMTDILLILAMLILIYGAYYGISKQQKEIAKLNEDINNANKKITYLQDDLQTQKDIFVSYIKGTLSMDFGGEQ